MGMRVDDTQNDITVNKTIGYLANLCANPSEDQLAEMSVIPERAVIDLAIAIAYCRWSKEIKSMEDRQGQPIVGEDGMILLPPVIREATIQDFVGSDGARVDLSPWLNLWSDDMLIENGVLLPSLDDYMIRALLECQRGSKGTLLNLIKELGTYEFAQEQMESMEGMRAGG
jgi:hypothetical protein